MAFDLRIAIEQGEDNRWSRSVLMRPRTLAHRGLSVLALQSAPLVPVSGPAGCLCVFPGGVSTGRR